MRLNPLGKVRRLLQAVDVWLTRRDYRNRYFIPPAPDSETERWESFFRSLDLDSAGASYIETHLRRHIEV